MGRPGESGLTLIEMLISVALLGFILISIAPLFIAAVKSNYSANEYTSVNMLARDKLEELENLPLTAAELNEGDHPNDLLPFLPDPVTGVPPSANGIYNPFSRTWFVTNMVLPLTPPAATTPFASVTAGPGQPYDYKQVDVTVFTSEGHAGIGARRALITGYVQNPNFSVPPPPTSTPIPATPVPTPP